MNVTTVGLLAPHLTDENHCAVLDNARHKSKREVEHQVAALRPRPAVPSAVRKLPTPEPIVPPHVAEGAQAASPEAFIMEPLPLPTRRAVVAPLAPECYKVQFTVGSDTHEKLRRAQDLLRHTIPNGDLAAIFDRALSVLIAELEKRKLAATDRPRRTRTRGSATSRHIPATVKRAVWKRDGGRCAFVGENGRCAETGFLEFHHVVPYARGGQSTEGNLEIRCAAHNKYEAELWFGLRPSVVKEDTVGYALE